MIDELLEMGVGDTKRLHRMRQTFEKRGKLFASDKNYVDSLARKHIVPVTRVPKAPSKTLPKNAPKETKPAAENKPVTEKPSIAKGPDQGNTPSISRKPSGQKPSQPKSKAWYLLPIFLTITGGIIMYIALRNKNRSMAKKGLGLGIFLGMLTVVFFAAVISAADGSSAAMQASSSMA